MAGMRDSALPDCYVRAEEPNAAEAAILVNEVRSLHLHTLAITNGWLVVLPIQCSVCPHRTAQSSTPGSYTVETGALAVFSNGFTTPARCMLQLKIVPHCDHYMQLCGGEGAGIHPMFHTHLKV